MQKPRKCKSCQIEYTPKTFAQPRCQKCTFQRLKDKQKNYKPLKAKRNPEQEKVNKEVRKWDKGKPCISCNKITKLEAGHFIPISKSQKLRYNKDNIHGQCFYCNRILYGNIVNYRYGLINRYGIEFVERLEKADKI